MEYIGVPKPPSQEEIEEGKQLALRLSDLRMKKEFLLPKILVRFIRARNGNIDAAEKMIRNHLEWRRKDSVDTLLLRWSPPENIKNVMPWRICTVDDLGCPVLIFQIGLWEPSDFRGRSDDLVKYFVHLVELGLRFFYHRSLHLPHVPQLIAIVDAQGLSWRHYVSYDAIHAGIQALRIYEANFPEALRVVFIVNVPSVLSLFYKIATPFLRGSTKEKITPIYGNKKEEWREIMMKYVPLEVVPVKYGGTLPDDSKISLALADEEIGNGSWMTDSETTEYATVRGGYLI